jgi:hypothetical protein
MIDEVGVAGELAVADVTVENVWECLDATIDRALCSPTRAVAYGRRWAPSTAVEYVRANIVLRGWCRPPSRGTAPPRWLNPLPCTSETLALFARYQLVERGKAPNTVRKWIAGVRAWHRLHGVPVPDGVPALAVLTEVETTLRARGWAPKHAEPLRLDHVIAAVAGCDRSTPRGLRDAALVLVGYAAKLTADRLRSLRLGDVTERPGGLDVAGVTLPHWTIAGEHTAALCPACTGAAWSAYLRVCGLTASAWWLRGVDRHQHVAGVDPEWTGQRSADGRMTRGSLREALVERLAEAGVDNPEAYNLNSLKAGGLAHRRRQGATLAELAAEAGLTDRSEQTLIAAIRAAEQWPATAPSAGLLDLVGEQ